MENLADVVKRLGPQGDVVEPWDELKTRAAELIGRNMGRIEAEETLMQFVRRKGWPEKMRAMVVQVVQIARQNRWTAESQANRLTRVEELQVVSLAGVKPKAVRWLWPGKIPLGSVTVIYGEQSMGKTSLVLDLAARASRGAEWADGTSGPGAGRVLILNGEDPLEEQIIGSGADLDHVGVITRIKVGVVEGATSQRRFELERDLPGLRQEVETLPEGRLVIIDSLEAFCGKLGRAEMRLVLAELQDIAADCGVAIVLVTAGTKCDLPVKNVWRMDCDPLDDGLRWWVPVRCNWGALPDGLAFRVTAEKIVWETRLEAPSAERSRGASSGQEKSCQLKEHAGWLKATLAAGPLPAKEVFLAASAAGWSAGQVRRAREALRVVCSKETKVNGQWVWELPGRVTRVAVGAEIEDVEGGKDVEDAVRVLVAA